MHLNRQTFFDRVRRYYWRERGQSMPQGVVDGLNHLLDCAEADPHLKDYRWLGYMLGTTAWETAWTFQPIDERGGDGYFERRYGFRTAVGQRLGNDAPGEGAAYHGRGDVQLTGEGNYERAETELRRQYPALVADFERRTGRRFDLTVGDQQGDGSDPDNAKDPAIAYAIMSAGMRQGWFTGRRLSHYINDKICDLVNARRIINGTDQARKIAAIAETFIGILREAMDADEILPLDAPKAAAPSVLEAPDDTPNGLPEQATPLPTGANTSDAPPTENNAAASAGWQGKVDSVSATYAKLKELQEPLSLGVNNTTLKGVIFSLIGTIGSAVYNAWMNPAARGVFFALLGAALAIFILWMWTRYKSKLAKVSHDATIEVERLRIVRALHGLGDFEL